MPGRSAAAIVAQEWARKAEGDLRAAAYLLEPRPAQPTDAVCFHAQQCAEKYLKALLVLRASIFRRRTTLRNSLPSSRPRCAHTLLPRKSGA